jgi:hypothetical protein
MLSIPVTGTEAESMIVDDEGDGACCPKKPRSTRSTAALTNKGPNADPICFFCDCGGSDLRKVLTWKVDEKVRRCASILEDSMLLGKLSNGDMIALDAMYHPSCLLSLYYKAERRTSLSLVNDNTAPYECEVESLALAEIISFLEESLINESTPSVFKLSELTKMYAAYLSKFKSTQIENVHSSRLKERLLENLPNLTAVNHGRDVLLTFADNLGLALQDLRDRASQDADAVYLMHAAKILRKEILSNKSAFTGDLKNSKYTVPAGLLYFVKMVMEGIGCVADNDSVAAASVAQLIVFNTYKRRRNVVCDNGIDTNAHVIRHSTDREPPLPIYIGLMLHSATRTKKCVNKCHKLGLCISYDRVMQITNKTANTVCEQYRVDNLVCPPSLLLGCFTVAAVDNIDHNLSSSTAHTSFHGTAISVTQYSDTRHEVPTCSYSLSSSDLASDITLPAEYTEVCPCILPTKEPDIPKIPTDLCSSSVIDDEYVWLKSIADCFLSGSERENWSWAAFHAEREQHTCLNYSLSVLLPLFRQSANTAAMMRHSLFVVNKIVSKVNPGQTPVLTADQPLFALLKQIQWHWPEKFGEDHCVILMGGLHIEMAALRMLGHWLAGSGWIECIVQAAIATAGVAESFISASHVKRTRYAHTVTAAALYINLQQTYALYVESVAGESVKAFDEWRADCAKHSVLFFYWSTVLDLELLVLSFVRSIRLGSFSLYVQCLQKLAPWFFVCDHTHYARWLPVHIRDMLNLPSSHPDVYEQFMLGKFTVAKTQNNFSCIALDHAHEQMNAVIKGDGGAVGLTENDAALSRWAVAGPEIVRILEQFESEFLEYSHEIKHHEQCKSLQNHFKHDVSKLVDVFNTEIPFSTTTGEELVILCTNTLADAAVSHSVRTAEDLGGKQFEAFFNERLSKTANISLTAPLTRNKLPLFLFKSNKKKNAVSTLRVSELKSDCELFSRLYISCQTRDGNLDEFFCYENQVYPPSLSQGGTLYSGTKSDLLDSLPVNNKHDIADLACSCCIMDGAVIVQMLRPESARTFADYRNKVFMPYILAILRKVRRIDVVFDVYRSDSLKLSTREKRGVGTRFKVSGQAKIPTNWHEFLRVDSNKTELFHFLAETEFNLSDTQGKVILFTYNESVRVATGSVDTNGIDGCNHEEADTRVILHAHHAAACGANTLYIRTVDTDIVVLAISFFSRLSLSELWIHFGTGKCARLLAVHEICACIGIDKCHVLPAFHALTGCDTTSAFRGKGKKSAWLTWESYPEVTHALKNLSLMQTDVNSDTMAILERFVILLYDRTSDVETLNAARKQMFTKKTRTLENIPPTSNAFLQHVKRCVLQAINCWSHSLETQMPVINPAEWGWSKDGDKWLPVWMTIPQVSKICQELLHCSCKKACTARCKCFKANLPCTSLCQCDGECERS